MNGISFNVRQHPIKLNLDPEISKSQELQDLPKGQEEEPIIVEKEPPKSLVHEQSQQKPKQKQEQLPLKNFKEVDPRTKVTNDRLIIPDEQEPVQPEPIYQEQPVHQEQPVQRQIIQEKPRSAALFDSSFSLKQMLIYGGLIASGLVLGINIMKSTEQVKHSNQFLH